MALQRTLVSLVLVASVAVSLAQPGLNLPPSGMSGFARGMVEDVRRVGASGLPPCRQQRSAAHCTFGFLCLPGWHAPALFHLTTTQFILCYWVLNSP